MNTTQIKKQVLPVEYDVGGHDEELYDTRPPSSARRYRPTQAIQQDVDEPTTRQDPAIQRRRSNPEPKSTSSVRTPTGPTSPPTRRTEQGFPLIPVLVGMVVMIVLVMGFSALSSWWQTYQDDLHYGRPRTSHLDAVVGHGDSPQNPTHLVFLNLNRHIEIIEIPGGDVSHTRIFSGPVLFGDGQDLTPVTGEIRDFNGDGKLDLIVHIERQQILFKNDGTTFRPQ